MNDNINDEYIFQKRDFIMLGVKSGSFDKLIKDLGINNEKFMIRKVLRNGINAKFFTQEAYNIVADYLKSKQDSNNSQELALALKNKSLEEQNQKLQNAIALMESQYTKQISSLTEEKLNQELEFEKEKHRLEMEIEKVKTYWENTREEYIKETMEVERLKNRGFFARLFNK